MIRRPAGRVLRGIAPWIRPPAVDRWVELFDAWVGERLSGGQRLMSP